MTDLYNPHLVGDAMRELCRRAMVKALELMHEAQPEAKGVKAGGRIDWVTQVDRACQDYLVELIQERFPDFGIIGEENGLRIPCTIPERNLYFTLDPIDGTSAYVRKEPGGWGCMIALVDGFEVISVCIGDGKTGEMYYYRPDTMATHRLERLGDHLRQSPLGVDHTRPLKDQFLQTRKMPHLLSPLGRRLVTRGPFAGSETASGSIGLTEARLWMGIVGASLVKRRAFTPWDDTPVTGMHRRLGFVTLRLSPEDTVMTLIDPPLRQHVMILDAPAEDLTIHRSDLPELRAWCDAQHIGRVHF